jgi:hypothetical protein
MNLLKTASLLICLTSNLIYFQVQSIYVNGQVGQDLTLTCQFSGTHTNAQWEYIGFGFTVNPIPPAPIPGIQQKYATLTQPTPVTPETEITSASLTIRNLVLRDTLNSTHSFYQVKTIFDNSDVPRCRFYVTVLPNDQPLSKTDIFFMLIGDSFSYAIDSSSLFAKFGSDLTLECSCNASIPCGSIFWKLNLNDILNSAKYVYRRNTTTTFFDIKNVMTNESGLDSFTAIYQDPGNPGKTVCSRSVNLYGNI